MIITILESTKKNYLLGKHNAKTLITHPYLFILQFTK